MNSLVCLDLRLPNQLNNAFNSGDVTWSKVTSWYSFNEIARDGEGTWSRGWRSWVTDAKAAAVHRERTGERAGHRGTHGTCKGPRPALSRAVTRGPEWGAPRDSRKAHHKGHGNRPWCPTRLGMVPASHQPEGAQGRVLRRVLPQ